MKDVQQVRNISAMTCTINNVGTNSTIVIVAKPSNSSCEQPKLSENNRTVSLTCRTEKIYPAAACLFKISNKTKQLAERITYFHQNFTDNNNLYYNSNCTWTSELSIFEAGTYSFNVVLLPNVTNNQTDFGEMIAPKDSLILTKPTVVVSRECYNATSIIDGYIKPNASVNCNCLLQNEGYPAGSVEWLDKNNLTVVAKVNNNIANLQITPSNDTELFYCTGKSILGNGNHSLRYTVTYALNPSACTVAPQTLIPTIWKMCNKEKSVNVTVFCDVKKSDVKPGIKSIISLNSLSSGLLNSEVDNTPNNMYRTRYDAVLSQAGNYTIGCQVQNSLFSEFISTCLFAVPIQIYAPPDNSPILLITSTSKNLVSSVQENVVYILKCTVLGGVPQVSNVTVSCGNITESTQSGNIFTSSVTFTRNMTGQNCICTAQHITGCYTKNIVQLQLTILYVPAVKQFYTDSSTEVDNGTWTMFVCEAGGNPLPQVSITHKNLIVYENLGPTASLNKSLSCGDSGIYTCKAENSIGTSTTSQNIELYVKCPLHFHASDDYTEFSLETGQQFVKTLRIFGYPEPSYFSVNKVGNKTNNVIVKYTSIDSASGTVDMNILNLVDFDFGYYMLSISQNGFPNLIYSFAIVKVSKDAEETFNVGAPVGGSIAAFVVIVLIVVAIVYVVRKKSNINKQAKRQQNQMYSEIAVSQSLQDRHTYEAPTMNSDFKLIDKSYTNIRYVNVTVNTNASDIQLNATRSPYCNQDVVHPELLNENIIEQKDFENEESPYVTID